MAVQEFRQALADVLALHRLDVAGVGHHPDLLRLGGARVEALGVLDRHDGVALAVDEEQRDGADGVHRCCGREIVVDRLRQQPLERPGEEEARRLVPDDAPVVREGAVDDDRPHVGAVLAVRGVVDRQGAAEALAEDDDALRIDVGQGKQRAHGRVGVELHALEGRRALRPAVAPVVEGEDVEARRRHPGDVGEMRADVLRVAVQVEHARPRLSARRQEPGEEGGAIGRLELHRVVFQAVLAGGAHDAAVRLEEGLRAAGSEQGECESDQGAHVSGTP